MASVNSVNVPLLAMAVDAVGKCEGRIFRIAILGYTLTLSCLTADKVSSSAAYDNLRHYSVVVTYGFLCRLKLAGAAPGFAFREGVQNQGSVRQSWVQR